MNMIEFGIACKPLNEVYKMLFGIIPTPADFSCAREEYLTALNKAVAEQQPIESFLEYAPVPSNDRYDY